VSPPPAKRKHGVPFHWCHHPSRDTEAHHAAACSTQEEAKDTCRRGAGARGPGVSTCRFVKVSPARGCPAACRCAIASAACRFALPAPAACSARARAASSWGEYAPFQTAKDPLGKLKRSRPATPVPRQLQVAEVKGAKIAGEDSRPRVAMTGAAGSCRHAHKRKRVIPRERGTRACLSLCPPWSGTGRERPETKERPVVPSCSPAIEISDQLQSSSPGAHGTCLSVYW
jgi:hypothetical protein